MRYYEDYIENFIYEPADDGIRITDYRGSRTNIKLPSHIDGKPVTQIGINPHGMHDVFFNVLIPETVRSFDGRAFYLRAREIYMNEGWIQNFELAEGNPYLAIKDDLLIADGDTLMFSTGFDKLTAVIPQGIKHIAPYAFCCCWLVDTVMLPEGLLTIEDHAFDGCSIVHAVLPEGLEKIGVNAFCNNSKFGKTPGTISAAIPASVTSLGSNASLIPLIDNNEHFTICDDLLLSADKKTAY